MDSVEPSDVAFGPEHVWLDRTGAVHLSPGVEPSVCDLGALLQQRLREVRRDGPARMPPGLVLLTARATGQIDAAPSVSTRALGTALARFEPSDPHEALRALVAAVEAAHSGTLGTPIADEVQGLDEPVIRPSAGRWRLRPAAAAALAAAGFAAGAAVASPRKGRLVRTPAVSPDGRWIMSQVSRDGAWLLDLIGVTRAHRSELALTRQSKQHHAYPGAAVAPSTADLALGGEIDLQRDIDRRGRPTGAGSISLQTAPASPKSGRFPQRAVNRAV